MIIGNDVLLTEEELIQVAKVAQSYPSIKKMLDVYRYVIEHPEPKIQIALNVSLDKIMMAALSGNVGEVGGAELRAYLLIAEKMTPILRSVTESKKSVLGDENGDEEKEKAKPFKKNIAKIGA